MPIYLSEENRARDGATIAPEAYQRALAAAKQAGAAGWVFHTGAGYELSKRPFLDALSPAERTALSGLK